MRNGKRLRNGLLEQASPRRPTVSTWPGSISMTLILVAMSSFLKLSVKLRTAALLAQ